MSRRVKASYRGVLSRRYDIAAGCDTDKELIVVAILNAVTGDVEVREFRQDHVDLVRCIEWFSQAKPEIIIIESTSTYHQLYYDGLLAAGLNIHVINPMVVKSLLRVEGKSDKGDAITLARLAASFDLHTSNVADSMQREMRLVFRTYDRLKVSRLQVINAILAYLSQHGCTIFQHIGINSAAALKIMDALVLGLPPDQVVLRYPRSTKRQALVATIPPEIPIYFRYWLSQQVTMLRDFNTRISETRNEILAFADKFDLQDQIQLMCTVPLFNPFLSLRIIAEMGQNFPKRYHNAAAFAKAIGVVPSNEVSGGKLLKRKGSHGNAGAKVALLQVAKAWALHPDVTRSPNLARWFIGYRKRANFMKATSALSRRCVEHLYHVCRTGIPYDDSQNSRLFGAAKCPTPGVDAQFQSSQPS